MVKIEVLTGFSAIFSSELAEWMEVYILDLVVESAVVGVVVVVGTPRGGDRKGSDGESNNLRRVSVSESFQEKYFFFPRALGNWECWEPSVHLS